MQDPTKLRVFIAAEELAVSVYLTTHAFPRSELYGLTSQMRRAAVSISSNIAEGCGRFGPGDMARFLQISIGSTSELYSQVRIARQLEFLGDQEAATLIGQVESVRRRLIRLHARVDEKRLVR